MGPKYLQESRGVLRLRPSVRAPRTAARRPLNMVDLPWSWQICYQLHQIRGHSFRANHDSARRADQRHGHRSKKRWARAAKGAWRSDPNWRDQDGAAIRPDRRLQRTAAWCGAYRTSLCHFYSARNPCGFNSFIADIPHSVAMVLLAFGGSQSTMDAFNVGDGGGVGSLRALDSRMPTP